MKEIILFKGQIAMVDDEDYEVVSKLKWGLMAGGYARSVFYINGKQKTILMHRLIMNAPPGSLIDHKDMNPLNNVKSNLRFADRALNSMNRGKQSGVYSSKYKGTYKRHGVWKYKKPWISQISFNNKSICLGIFELEIEAAKAYDRAAIKYFGEFARLNFPDG